MLLFFTFDGDLVLAGARVLEQIDLDGDLANAALVWGVCERKKRVNKGWRSGRNEQHWQKKRDKHIYFLHAKRTNT